MDDAGKEGERPSGRPRMKWITEWQERIKDLMLEV